MDAASTTLLIVANGPGEIGGWVLPIARELRGQSDALEMRLVLALAPSQFASGTEQQTAAASGLFDAIIPPRTCLALALGLGRLAQGPPAAILHLGGDLWISRLMAGRWAVPAFAFAETLLISHFGHHRAFAQIFVPSARLAARLAERGVSRQRIVVTGDPRLDRLPPRAPSVDGPAGRTPQVTMLAGSRERLFRLLFPFWAETGVELRRLQPDASISIAISPDLPAGAVAETVAPWREILSTHRLIIRREGTPEAIAGADLVLTIPGTTTMEVAALPVATMVVLPLALADAAPAEGLLEWVLRLPLLRALRRVLAVRWVARNYAALPNRLTGRPILPEVPAATPPPVATYAFALLHDDARRREIEAALAEVAGPRGASRRIAERILVALRANRAASGAAVRVAG